MKTDQDIFTLQMMLEGCQFYEQIGSSPLANLYRVAHPQWGDCVLKHIKKILAQERKLLEKFFQPLEKLKGVQHPNIGQIYELRREPEVFILREMIMGTSVQERLKIKGAFEIVEATQIVLDVAMGIFAGYPLGIVYKSLKPANIILLPDNTACLVDISLPPTDAYYIAPEQWKKKKSDTRSDIYALGIIYYEMLTGSPPFLGNSKEEIQNQHLHLALPLDKIPKDFPSSLQQILETMLQKDPDQRYRSPLPLIGALREALKDMGVPVKSFPSSIMRPSSLPSLKENKEKDSKEEESKKERYTTLMVAFSREEEIYDDTSVTEEPTRRISLSEFPPEKDKKEEIFIEEIYLSRRSLEENPQNALKRVTFIEEPKERQRPLPTRVVHFPKDFEELIIKHLYDTFRRETWLLKESDTPGEMEVEIDLEQSCIYLYFYRYEDQLQKALQEQGLPETVVMDPEDKDTPRSEMETIDLAEEEIICLSENENKENLEETLDPSNDEVATINDITIKTISATSLASHSATKPHFHNPELEIEVNFLHPHQTMAWAKFVRVHNLVKGDHFDIKENGDSQAIKKFVIYLNKLENYQREREHIARIKEFFQADYDIVELDRGGMGAVLKLTAKNDPTILSLRRENYWARQRFKEYLRVVKDVHGKEIIYAEIPKGTEFVVKVAFEGYEESLIQEAQILSKLAEDPHVCHTIIGAVQQGRLYTLDEKSDQTRIGYYIMLEYAPQGNTEQLYRRFPNGRLSPTIAFAIMYGMVQTLQRLKRQGIIHRDIKPQNILLDKNGLPKLSDFGLAITTTEQSNTLTEERRRLLRILDEKFLHISRNREKAESTLSQLEEQKRQREERGELTSELDQKISEIQKEIMELKEQESQRAEELKERYRLVSAAENAMKGKFAGSLYYAAPEQLDTEVILTPKCDVYQLGSVMFTLLTGRRPVEGKSTVEVMSRILYPVKREVSEIIKGKPVVDALSKLIHRMMTHNPEERIDIDEVREELDRILFEHALELKEYPVFEKPSHIQTEEQEERWNHKVSLAKDLHKKCVDIIFSTIFQNQKLPTLSKEVKKIVFNCPHCGKKLHIYRYMDGKKGTCPGCHRRILVKLQEENT